MSKVFNGFSKMNMHKNSTRLHFIFNDFEKKSNLRAIPNFLKSSTKLIHNVNVCKLHEANKRLYFNFAICNKFRTSIKAIEYNPDKITNDGIASYNDPEIGASSDKQFLIKSSSNSSYSKDNITSTSQNSNEQISANIEQKPVHIPVSGPNLVVFSGGTAFNDIAGKLTKWTTNVSYVLPVSDDGGSTAEISRVLGGPAVGDIRSRCLRLADDSNSEAKAVRNLLAHRLPVDDESIAKREWYSILEGDHELWNGVSEPYKDTIKAFLIHFQSEILKNASQKFQFRNGSVGNFFFAGARIFFRSLEAAVFLFSRVAQIPDGSKVMPAIDTDRRIVLGAELVDHTIIIGQSEISHPSVKNSENYVNVVCKDKNISDLHSAISRVFYLSSQGTSVEHEVLISANKSIPPVIADANMILYGIGSLYTSICCSLILINIGEAISSNKNALKVLLLNGSHDRETSKCKSGKGKMDAFDIAIAIVNSLNRRHCNHKMFLRHLLTDYITIILYPAGTNFFINREKLEKCGIKDIREVESVVTENGNLVYKTESLIETLKDIYNSHSLSINKLKT